MLPSCLFYEGSVVFTSFASSSLSFAPLEAKVYIVLQVRLSEGVCATSENNSPSIFRSIALPPSRRIRLIRGGGGDEGGGGGVEFGCGGEGRGERKRKKASFGEHNACQTTLSFFLF